MCIRDRNIGYSLFSYIIIVTVLSFLISHIEHQKKELGIYSAGGILCYMPRTSKCLSLFVLAGIGLPVTSLSVSYTHLGNNASRKEVYHCQIYPVFWESYKYSQSNFAY